MRMSATNVRWFGVLTHPALIVAQASMLALKVLLLTLSLYIDSVYPSSIQVPLDLHKYSMWPKMKEKTGISC